MRAATQVAIVGTSGRGDDGPRMTKQLFDLMVTRAQAIIRDKLDSSPVHLVSGGAAWAGCVENLLRAHSPPVVLNGICLFLDHVAVALFFLEDVYLTLHLPCGWDHTKEQFIDKGTFDWRTNPGRSLNRYHRQFTSKTGYKSLRDIHLALAVGACAKIHSGFHQQNAAVANADVLIAFSWSTEGYPIVGGTADTWRKCKSRKKIHVNLNDLAAECAGSGDE